MRWTFGVVTAVLLLVVVAPSYRGDPASAQASPLTWRPCDGAFECATLKVPRDYNFPSGTQVELALVRLKASNPAQRIGSLVMNPGGPGGSAIELVEGLGPNLAPAIRARFDIVGFDPRGVGRSTPIVCHDNLQELFGVDPDPDTPAEWAAVDAAARTFAEGCNEAAGDLLQHIGTANVARDMEQLRIALGEEKLTYLGYSYGTVIGSVYADLYPSKVRAMVLDGAFVYWGVGEAALRVQSEGFENALHAYAMDCIRIDCIVADLGDPFEVIDGLLAMVEVEPIPAPGTDRPAGPAETTVGIFQALYSESLWPVLDDAIVAAYDGDGTLLVQLADDYLRRRPDGTYPNQSEMYLSVGCVDYKWPSTLAEFQSLAQGHDVAAPHFGVANLLQSALPCLYWDVEPQPLTAPRAAGAPPIVVIATTNDPATPYQSGVAVSQQLAAALLLTNHGEGHTVYGSGHPCVDRVVNDYLLTLKTFADGSSCYRDVAELVAPGGQAPTPTPAPTEPPAASPTATATPAPPTPAATPVPPTATPSPASSPAATPTSPAPLPPAVGSGSAGEDGRTAPAWLVLALIIAAAAGTAAALRR